MLYFPVTSSDFLDYDGLLTVYSLIEEALPDKEVSTRLQLIVGEYTVDGQFLGYHSVEHGRIQLCPDSVKRLDAAYDVGVDYRQKVTIHRVPTTGAALHDKNHASEKVTTQYGRR